MRQLFQRSSAFLVALAWSANAQDNLPYTTYTNFNQVIEARNARYPAMTRVSDPGTSEHRIYTGFFFYQVLQFDTTGRYLLGLRVYFQSRNVKPDDRGDVGYIDLKDGFRWTKIGESAAWNWQQGNRLQWRPQSDEIVWNDRSDDGKKFVTRTYDFRSGKRRTLPRPIYDLSPDGSTALTHDYERMNLFKGTEYIGIEDVYEKEFAPSQTGIWKRGPMSAICITTRVTMRGRMTITSWILAGTRLPVVVHRWEVTSSSKMMGPVKPRSFFGLHAMTVMTASFRPPAVIGSFLTRM